MLDEADVELYHWVWKEVVLGGESLVRIVGISGGSERGIVVVVLQRERILRAGI